MFGVLLRAAPQALFIALLAAVMAEVTNPLVDQMTAGGAEQSDLLVVAVQSGTENAVLVGIVGLVVTLVARATIEARLGGI
jgi:hypothetical protein